MISDFIVSFPNIISASILLLIGIGVSIAIWFISKKIFEYIKVDKKIKFKFLNKNIKISFWLPIIISILFVFTFLSEALNVLNSRFFFVAYYLVSYYTSIIRLLFWMVIFSTLYFYLKKRYKSKKK